MIPETNSLRSLSGTIDPDLRPVVCEQQQTYRFKENYSRPYIRVYVMSNVHDRESVDFVNNVYY